MENGPVACVCVFVLLLGHRILFFQLLCHSIRKMQKIYLIVQPRLKSTTRIRIYHHSIFFVKSKQNEKSFFFAIHIQDVNIPPRVWFLAKQKQTHTHTHSVAHTVWSHVFSYGVMSCQQFFFHISALKVKSYRRRDYSRRLNIIIIGLHRMTV